jgi:hypothetical protein
MTERRRLIATAGRAMAAAATAIIEAPNVIAPPKIQWRLSTARSAALDVYRGPSGWRRWSRRWAQSLAGPWDHMAEGAYHRLVGT